MISDFIDGATYGGWGWATSKFLFVVHKIIGGLNLVEVERPVGPPRVSTAGRMDVVCSRTGQQLLIDVGTPVLAGWLAGWLAYWLAGWLASWLAGWLASWLAGWLAGWLIHACWAHAKHMPPLFINIHTYV